MLQHDWVIEEVDGGAIGVEDFWICRRCGASGGLAYCLAPGFPPSIAKPFVNGKIGGPMDLPDDCEVAAELIEKYWATKTVGVYGGSFNPVTWGHVIAVINLFLTHQVLDQILVVPCFQQNGKNLIDFHHRLKMCQLAFENINYNVNVSDIEYQLGGESHTHRTLLSLKEKYPNWNLRFVIGFDLKESYKSWESAELIDQIAPPIIMPRPGFSDKKDFHGLFLADISSTIVRDLRRAGSLRFLNRTLPQSVFSYILENKLYL